MTTRIWLFGGAGALVLSLVVTPARIVDVSPAQTVDASTDQRVIASNGAVIFMPVIDNLDCTEMSNALRRIDLSNYRGHEPVLEDQPDWPIFVYEDKLTKKFYYTCTLGENQLDDPGSAFSYGFDSQ